MNFGKKDFLYFSLFAICIGLVVWTKVSTPKVAYVRSAVLVEKYKGTKEALARTEHKVEEWQANIDTLQKGLEQQLVSYQNDFNKLSEKERKEREKLLELEKDKFENYKSAIEKKALEEQDKALQGALNQLNSFIDKYSKENDIDVVLGVTKEGNILYGKEAIDITEKLVEEINKYSEK